MEKKKNNFYLNAKVKERIFKRLVCEGKMIENVVYKSRNLIINIAKTGGKRLVILGSGYSMSLDKDDRVLKCDPLMILPSMKYFGENTTVISVFYPFETEGLEQAGKELSSFINSELNEFIEVILIGHSKCGVCFANAAKWMKRKCIISTISAPFEGTPIVEQEDFLDKCNWLEKKVYRRVFSNHKVDQDIGINSEFIKNADYSGLINHHFINIISHCPKKTINPVAMYLIAMDSKGIYGDGISPLESQKISVNSKVRVNIGIQAVHSNSLGKGLELIKEILKF